MVREMQQVLQVLGWGDGLKIPVANAENKELERQVEELLKKKAEAIVHSEVINEQEDVMRKHLKTMEAEKDYNQKLINNLKRQLDDDMRGMKGLEFESNKQSVEIKELKKEVSEMNSSINKLKADIASHSNKMNFLKEALKWGEDTLFAWEEELAKGEKEMEFLEKYKAEDEDKFKKLETERLQVESDLIEAKALEKREADRFQILQTQLENISKLFKEAYNEKKRLTKVWFDSANVIRNREEDIQRFQDILCEVKNKARSKCIELYDQKGFYEEIKNINCNVSKEIQQNEVQFGRLKETVMELENATNFYKNEVDARKRASGNISSKLENQRRKNTELIEKNKSRLKKYNRILEENTCLQEQCDLLKVDSMSADQKYKNAENMYEMSCKASSEDTKELERLNLLILQIKQEINKLQDNYTTKTKELSYLTKKEQDLTLKSKNEEKKLKDLETTVDNLLIDESILVKKITELQNKCSSKEEKEELEKEVAELQSKESDLIKDEYKIHQHIKTIQREYQDFIKKLRNGEEEINSLEESLRSMKRTNDLEKKHSEKTKEEINKLRLQLNLLMMKECFTKDNIARDDDAVSKLERQRIILEATMKERKIEINAQQEILLGKKRTLMEEKSFLRRTLEHLNQRIKQIQSRYAVSMDLLGKDESGKSLSVAHFKIKLAQEKYELQMEGDELEAKVNKTEREIQAMENTLKLLTSANENLKISLEAVGINDPEMMEKERLEIKYCEVKKLIKEDSDFLSSVRREIEELITDISEVKQVAKDLEEDWKQKEKEVTFLEKDLATKQVKLNRATQLLIKMAKDVRKAKEPAPYKKLAQKEIDMKIQDERNKSVLQQMLELTTNYLETKPIVNRYITEQGLSLPLYRTSISKSQLITFSDLGGETTRSKDSIKSDSTTSVVIMDPNQIFREMPSCLVRKNKF